MRKDAKIMQHNGNIIDVADAVSSLLSKKVHLVRMLT